MTQYVVDMTKAQGLPKVALAKLVWSEEDDLDVLRDN
jgi:hypothetical protein